MATSGASHAEMVSVPAIPMATAPLRLVTARTMSVVRLRRVCSGRPWSSSSAWAAIPTARKNAASAAARRSAWSTGATAAPRAT